MAIARTEHRPWPLPTRPWVGRQSWCDLLFAHWPVPAAAVRPLVPPALDVQEFGGTSWVGVVPFRMEDVMLRGLPALPWLSAFPELNVRLYVEYAGKPGVWFLSLDASSRLAVWGARRVFSLPYFHARMRVARRGEWIAYASHRREAPPAALEATYRPTSAPAEPAPGTLEHFLTERYCLYALLPDGTLRRTEIHHPPWPLQRAEAEIAHNAMLAPAGVPAGEGEPLLHFSRRQDVVVWAPVPVEA